VLPDAPAAADGWANFFDDLAPRYEQAAFEGAGLAAVSARELRVVRAALCDRTPGRVLDAGAGTGRISDACRMLGWSVTAFDASAAMVSRLRARHPSMPVLHATLGRGRLPLAPATFDAVVSLRVLKYVEDLDGALTELARVLRHRRVSPSSSSRTVVRSHDSGTEMRRCTLRPRGSSSGRCREPVSSRSYGLRVRGCRSRCGGARTGRWPRASPVRLTLCSARSSVEIAPRAAPAA
jgi:SAM-dependent methyltransferase